MQIIIIAYFYKKAGFLDLQKSIRTRGDGLREEVFGYGSHAKRTPSPKSQF